MDRASAVIEHPAGERRARRERGRREGLEQVRCSEDRERRQEARCGAGHRAQAREGERPVGEASQQVPAMRAAQAQVGLLAPLRGREHASRVGGEERRQQRGGQAEEEEHPLADRGVGARDWSVFEMLSMR